MRGSRTIRTNARQWRGSRIALLACACALLIGTALSAMRQVADGARSEVESVLRQASASHAASLAEQFAARGRLVLMLSHHPAVRQRFPERRQLAVALNEALTSSDGSVVSAALVDEIGRVYVQVVNGTPVDARMRTRRSAEMPQLAPTLGLSVGVARHSTPYFSKQTGRWVIATTTLIEPGGDAHPRILVMLSDLTPVRRELAVGDSRVIARVIDADGVVVANGRDSGSTSAAPRADAERNTLRAVRDRRTIVVRNGQAFSTTAIDSSTVNDNAWWVVASMPAPGGGSLLRSGGAATAMAVATLLMLIMGVLTLRRHRETLSTAQISDPLTGLPNRAALAEHGAAVLARGDQDGYLTAVLCINLLNFRAVNDALGHDAGDHAICEVTQRLQSALQAGDLLVRLGGDEFAILVSKVTDRAGAEDAARKILARLDTPIAARGHAVGIHAIMGGAVAPADGTTIDELVECAGRAMYHARRRSRQLQFFTPEIHHQATDRLALVSDLRAALESDQLQLHFQPKINLGSGRVDGVEAVVRWNHPRHGLLLPSEFVPMAEQTGLIGAVTAKAITLALSQTRRWLDEGLELPVAVNLSGQCIQDRDTVDVVARGLTRWQIPPRLLKLEIPESALENDLQRARQVMHDLDELGVALVVDDYGRGYSSLTNVDALPIREVKIDRLLLDQMESGHDSANLVRSTIELGHKLGLRVVAEGIEDRNAVRALVGLGCDAAQGNFFCAPMDAAAFRTWLRERNGSASAGLSFERSRRER